VEFTKDHQENLFEVAKTSLGSKMFVDLLHEDLEGFIDFSV
jgi:hypothetical protein